MFLYSLLIFHVNIVGGYEREYVKIAFASEISDDSLAFRSQQNAPSELPPHPRVENPSHGERHPGFERWPLEETQTTNSKLVDGDWTSMVRTRKKTQKS